MIKRILLFVLQLGCFFGLLDLGGNWDIINLSYEMRQLQQGIMQPKPLLTTIKYQISATHILIANGLIFAGILLALILLVLALRKKLKPWGGITVAAFICALVVAFSVKLGIVPAPTPDSLLQSHTMTTFNS